jgi:hypothetical protein
MPALKPLLAILAFLVLFISSNRIELFAQTLSTQDEMHERIISTYSFSPSKVTEEVRSNKSKEMDSFWDDVKGHRETALPFLRVELKNPENPKFFFADGSALLLSLSQTLEDKRLAADCLARVDLSDFQSHQFLYEVNSLAVQGIDVTPAALHILDDPKFVVYLPEHGAYKLDQTACLLFMLLPQTNKVWLQQAIDRLKVERDETAVKSLLVLLFYAQSEDADTVIQSIGVDHSASPSIRKFVQSIQSHERELGVGAHPSPSEEARYREERRLRMASISDEAVDDMDELTGKIAKAREPASTNR